MSLSKEKIEKKSKSNRKFNIPNDIVNHFAMPAINYKKCTYWFSKAQAINTLTPHNLCVIYNVIICGHINLSHG